MKDKNTSKDGCCQQSNAENSAKEQEMEKPSQECLANQLLAAQDATGMDLDKATQIIADEDSDDDARANAEDMLATADEGDMDIACAEKVLAEAAMNCSEKDKSDFQKAEESSTKEKDSPKAPSKESDGDENIGADEEKFNEAAIGSENDDFGKLNK